MVCANGIFFIVRSIASIKDSFQLLEEVSKEVGLVVNEGKTKYMVAANTQNCSKPRAIGIERYNVELLIALPVWYIGDWRQ
jgi:hypothetical protein